MRQERRMWSNQHLQMQQQDGMHPTAEFCSSNCVKTHTKVLRARRAHKCKLCHKGQCDTVVASQRHSNAVSP
jgi:hypothetical protein